MQRKERKSFCSGFRATELKNVPRLKSVKFEIRFGSIINDWIKSESILIFDVLKLFLGMFLLIALFGHETQL